MDKEEKIIRSFFEPIEDINQSESIQVLPLSLADMLLEYEESIKTKTLFEFKYNSDTYEGGATTISIHRTRKGAEMALEFHKDGIKKHLDKMYINDPEDKPSLDEYQWWGVEETEVLD